MSPAFVTADTADLRVCRLALPSLDPSFSSSRVVSRFLRDWWVMRDKVALPLLIVLLLVFTPASVGQQRNQLTLRQLTSRAGYIFVGRVKSVQYIPATSGHVATMKIRFQVEQGLRGVRSGSVLTIRQWAGLWDAGERYRTGERLLLFLYRPSKLGLTSPVGGFRGRFALDRNGQVLLGMERAMLWRDSLQHLKRDRIPLRSFARSLRGFEEE